MSVSDVFDSRELRSLEESLRVDARPFVTQLQSVLTRSRFYQEKWTDEHVSAIGDLTEDNVAEVLASLPITTKDELRVSQEISPPYGIHLACDESVVNLVHRTSGTTGRPLVIAASASDMDQTFSHGAQAFWCAGLRDEDVVVHCLNYCMWAGGYTDHRCLEATGAAVIPFGVGNTSELESLQSWMPFSALSCTPSYISLLIEQMDDQTLELWARNLKLVLVGGEPGGSERLLADRVRVALGARLVNANYGLAEVLSNFASECEHGSGMHFHGHEAIWIELIEEGTGRSVPIAQGSRGTVVLSHVRRDAQPLVRYDTNDVMEVLSTDTCPCGRSSFRFRLQGRADDMFVVRGINVFPGSIKLALSDQTPALSEFAVFLPDTTTFDRIPLVVEKATPDSEVDIDSLEQAIKARTGCGVSIEVVEPFSLPRSESKTQRVYRGGNVPPGLQPRGKAST